MKRAADFIVEKRKVILFMFAFITLCSAWLMTKVTVNYDMTKYLPKESQTKAGLDIMDAEFPAANSLNVMFKGLSENEKARIYSGLSEVEHVKSVSYEAGSERYNKDGYTLYTISMDCGAYTAEAKTAVDAIRGQYPEYDIVMSGEAVGTTGMINLPALFIPALAILLVILFLMCNSWFEPAILICNIGIAIIINMGTNAVFDSVSEITQAIAAVLQLVLSMDYSIMLINRYRQEKQLTDNKYDAMKKALRNAFTAISSSSVTTIVGMLMLVFMSFTIGLDLGLVLAKGVFFSLLCIFTVMPALILMSDRLIEKTTKPSLQIKMNKLASFAYSARYAVLAVFLVLFAGGFILRSNVGINYTMNDFDEIYEVFSPENSIIVVYDNKDEESIASLADQWAENAHVKSVNAYATTLGKELTGAELADAMDMDKSTVDLLYYCYFNGKKGMDGAVVPLGDFLRFISDDVASNELFSQYFDESAITQFDTLLMFTDKNTINRPLDSSALSQMTGMDAEMIEQVFYLRSGGTGAIWAMSIYDFVTFVLTDLADNANYAAAFDPSALQQLGFMKTVMDSAQDGKMYTAAEMLTLLGSGSDMIDENTLELLYLFYYSAQDGNPDWKLPIYDFMRFIVNDITDDERFSAFFSDDMVSELNNGIVEMDDGLMQLVGNNFSRLIINTNLSVESDEAFNLIANLEDELGSTVSGDYYIIGNSAMAHEMADSFPNELNFITILTAVSIFFVVLIAFRSFSIPLILVCVIQCAVFVTMGTVYVQGSSIYYLALLIVQCLMMGATIDYGILYTSYYKEARTSMSVKESIGAALNNAIHTIMTSGLILVVITLVLGIIYTDKNYAISEILLIVARGCLCSMILVVFILPSLLAVLDRFVVKNKLLTNAQKPE